jgi:hypothetical protein
MGDKRESRDKRAAALAEGMIATVESEGKHGQMPDHWREPLKKAFMAAIVLDFKKKTKKMRNKQSP